MCATVTLRTVSDPEDCLQEPADLEEKRIPEKAFLWGFVRRTANEKDDSAGLRETDVALWLDETRYRFVVAAGRAVKDDLAPLEFIQFIREFKHSRSQTLFKVGNSFERSPRRATPVWSRPVATVIQFPTKLQLLVRGAARQERAEAWQRRNSDSAAAVPPAARGASARPLRRRVGNASAARFS
jgi:hypothetical protein